MTSDPAFITDASLSGAAKWLRLLGYDTVVYQGQVGRPMMRQAVQEQRILLTRKRDMTQRQFSGRLCLVAAGSVGAQLQDIVEKNALRIFPEKMLRICLVCNEPLTPVSKEQVQDQVPAFIFENCQEFRQCDRCEKIFWKGSHISRAMQFLERHHIKITVEKNN